jgi:hypothetical protein
MIAAQQPSLTSSSTTATNTVRHSFLTPSISFPSNFSPSFHAARRNPRFLSRLRTLELSCGPFCIRRPLFSMACALFDKNTGPTIYLSSSSTSLLRFALDSDRLCFHNLTNPFFRNPCIFTSIQNPRGVAPSTPPFTGHQSRITSHFSLLSCSVLRAFIHETC